MQAAIPGTYVCVCIEFVDCSSLLYKHVATVKPVNQDS